ncbi:DDE-type integrase/transposase/recombinase [Microvirga sp. 3-52]|nr:DDE-type integrase/transposase/recombinase [Microvirga sp. 3-52]
MPDDHRKFAGSGAGGPHDNYGSALAAHPGQSKGQPDNNTSSQLIRYDGLPTFRAPDTPIPVRRGYLIRQPSETRMEVSRLFMPDNNIIEADHGALKRVIRPTRGFQRTATASATIKGFEVMRMIRRGHCGLAQRDVIGEIRLVNQLFGLAA